jgi:hypothetical protein
MFFKGFTVDNFDVCFSKGSRRWELSDFLQGGGRPKQIPDISRIYFEL